jgi:hypothetical protein
MAILSRMGIQFHWFIWSDFRDIIWYETVEQNNAEFIVLFAIWLLNEGPFLINQIIFNNNRFSNDVDQFVNNFHKILVE